MKYVYLTSFGIVFTAIVGALQVLVNPQNWASLQSITLGTWIGVGIGFVILMGLAIFCLKQVRRIDDKDEAKKRETRKQEIRNTLLEAFREAGLLNSSPQENEDKNIG
jgi:large-conductance mechanosensitive channel